MIEQERVRQGECTPGCGACCRVLRLQVPPDYYTNPDVKKWVELHDIKLTQPAGGGTFAYIKMPCSALTDEGMCSLMDSEDRPELCSHYPATPEALVGVEDVCTYSFSSA